MQNGSTDEDITFIRVSLYTVRLRCACSPDYRENEDILREYAEIFLHHRTYILT